MTFMKSLPNFAIILPPFAYRKLLTFVFTQVKFKVSSVLLRSVGSTY